MNHLQEGRRVLDIEIKSLLSLMESLGDEFNKVVELLFHCRGKVILTGMGKSGLIAQKISSTFSSTGTPSFFLHPAEGAHGDLGVIGKEDVVLAISNGGESSEMYPLFHFVIRKKIPMVAMTANGESSLAKASQLVLDISVPEEACPLGLAPTSSTTVSLALGDALAMALLKYRGFKESDYAEFHPGGSLGRKLLTRVRDIMHKKSSLPLVLPETPLSEVITAMTSMEVRGIAGIVDAHGSLLGIITDGDIRRCLEKRINPFDRMAKDIMSANPKTIDLNAMAVKSLNVMEEHAIQNLIVVDISSSHPQSPVGVVHLQDLLREKIK